MQIATGSGSPRSLFLSQAPHAAIAQNADDRCLKLSRAVLEEGTPGGKWLLPEVSLGPPDPGLRIMLSWVFVSQRICVEIFFREGFYLWTSFLGHHSRTDSGTCLDRTEQHSQEMPGSFCTVGKGQRG